MFGDIFEAKNNVVLPEKCDIYFLLLDYHSGDILSTLVRSLRISFTSL
jgi:hypothetical protein